VTAIACVECGQPVPAEDWEGIDPMEVFCLECEEALWQEEVEMMGRAGEAERG
jgi:hypothetical protein